MKVLAYIPGISETEGLIEITDDKNYLHEFVQTGWDHFKQCPIYYPSNMIHNTENQFDDHFNHIRKVKFESHLALEILKNSNLFLDTLHKIGKSMSDYLHVSTQSDKDFMKKAGQIFKNYFYTDKNYFGKLGSKKDGESYSISQSFNLGIKILKEDKSIEHLLFAHMAVLNIFKNFKNNKQNETFLNFYNKYFQIFRPSIYFDNRGRVKKNKKEKSTISAGYESQSTIRSKLTSHNRAIDSFDRDALNPSSFAFESFKKDIPFVAGPSGSTAECFISALTFMKGQLTKEECRLYALCCVGYLVGSGAHSFHEVLCIANLNSVPYTVGRYENSIPEFFRKTKSWNKLLNEYGDIIKNDNDYNLLYKESSELKSHHEPFSGNKENTPINSIFNSKITFYNNERSLVEKKRKHPSNEENVSLINQEKIVDKKRKINNFPLKNNVDPSNNRQFMFLKISEKDEVQKIFNPF